MAYDNDFRSGARDRDGREANRTERGGRGFFERAGDEVASWFGDDQAEQRRDQDERSSRHDRPGEERHDRGGWFGGASYGRQDGDRHQRGRHEYRPLGDDERSGVAREWTGRDNEPRGSAPSGSRDQFGDPHYSEWRQRQIDALDRDYADYRREHQSKFETDFSGWRTQRQSKREILAGLRDGMEVVGSDDQRIGSVDKVRGDRVILRKNDPEAGGVHRSLSCALIDRIDGDRLILAKPAEQAKAELQREDSGQAYSPQERDRSRNDPVRGDASRDDGPHVLERSFSGTYR